MTLVFIKILIGLCAFAVAVIAASGKPLISQTAELSRKRLWGRLTDAGKINIACAIAAFLLLGISEIWIFFDESSKVAEARGQYEDVSRQLTKARAELGAAKSAVGHSLLETTALKRENEYLVRTLDKSVVRAGVAKVHLRKTSGVGEQLKFTDGREIKPENEDEIEWRFVCSGELPPLSELPDSNCESLGYGRLLANGWPIILDGKEGKRVFFGTRSRGGVLEYRNPSEEYSCNVLTSQMEAADCELQLTLWTEARWQFSEMKQRDQSKSVLLKTQDACRKYAALYGETCEDAVDRLANEDGDPNVEQ